jgi:parvulin-like peptidyl-prolyl isomerase
MIGVAALIVVILAGGIVYEYVVKPNQVLAQVNGHEIRRRDYWKYQSVALYQQARTYESYAMQTTGEQQQQFLQFAASFDAQRDDVWGNTDVSPTTLQQMVNDQLYLSGANELGISFTDEDIQTFALNQFAPPEAPLQTPIPSPTMIPERAQWATETAEALATQQSIALGTPVADSATPIAGEGTPGATPVAGQGTPMAGTPVAATPITDQATPVASDTGTPEGTPEPTMTMDESLQTANAEYDIFQDEVFDDAHMSESDYLELWAKPRYVRQLVNAQLTNAVPQTAEQVNAQHIMVSTEDLANQLYQQATGGADFSALARSNSTDTLTASTGGQLGWFTRLEVSDTFGEAAFALAPGEISQPVHDGDAWHIIRVIERDDARSMTDTQYQAATADAIDSWLATQTDNADISGDDLPEPTVTAEAFAPPAGAPTPVPATPIPVTPTPTPPLIGPEPVVPGGTPGATPVTGSPGTPAATPVTGVPGTPPASPVGPAATPVAGDQATPMATPAVASPAVSGTPNG